MKRHGLVSLSLSILVLLGVTPALKAETVVGYFDGQIGGGNAGTGAMTLFGWALSASGIKKVVFQVDGVDVGQAIYGHPRPDVETNNPGYPDSAAPGFGYRLNSTDFANGLHKVSVKVFTRDGTVANLPPTRSFHFNNNTTILVPFGKITTPHRNAELYGTCDPNAPSRRYAVVDGWALDLGVEIGDTGIGWVELLVDGSLMANTRVACTYFAETGGLTQCYGLPRLGIEREYPFALDAANSGFRFVLDIGYMIDTLSYAQGHHVLSVRAGDISNQFADIDEFPVTFYCIENIPNEGAYGKVETPHEGRVYSGDILFQGWAVDWEAVKDVRLFIDGKWIGDAAYGAADGIFETRPSVYSMHSGFPDVNAPVWRMVYDSVDGPFGELPDGGISDGYHQLQVRIVDQLGGVSYLGERTFKVDNVRD